MAGIPIVYGTGSDLEIGLREVEHKFVSDVSITHTFVDEIENKYASQSYVSRMLPNLMVRHRVKLAVMNRCLWQERYRAGENTTFNSDTGNGVLASSVPHTAIVYWCGFVPLKETPDTTTHKPTVADVAGPAAALTPTATHTGRVGHFCMVQLFTCDLTKPEGILLCACGLYLVSLNAVMLYPKADHTSRPPPSFTENPLTTMLKSLANRRRHRDAAGCTLYRTQRRATAPPVTILTTMTRKMPHWKPGRQLQPQEVETLSTPPRHNCTARWR